MPGLYIITGSNGAGKSSVGSYYLPPHIQQDCTIFDGDKLFLQKQKELWQSGITAHKEARKLAYQFVTDSFDNLEREALEQSFDFAYEGHFTNEATWDIPKKFKTAGYHTFMLFLGLTDVKLSLNRVAARAKEGGHYVDPNTVTANFYGNLEKLNIYYSLFDKLEIIDTSETNHVSLAIFQNGNPQNHLPSASLPEWFQNYLPSLVNKIKAKE
ncbi:MAG TPA: zeta toxin family protein [Chitinophaga sp.]|uniref:zeta toxin family protein n=1 Tax=Chitinophaga sp. TaxID=1869181 RepID=UPI002CA91020|nr:zeta toxin family protein [Chitinophaga sp.]HVI44051.1 zeta toxin family protein [Chitinophaga sp.]